LVVVLVYIVVMGFLVEGILIGIKSDQNKLTLLSKV